MSWRQVAVAATAIAATTGATLLCLELVLRLLPVREPMNPPPVHAGNPYIHSAPNRVHQYSRGWNFSVRAKKRINNRGFASDYDYVPQKTGPLLAVIGDSYVEALQVSNADSAAALLHRRVSPRNGRVYGFGYSGASLAQYLAYAQLAATEFVPDGIVFVVVGNDFEESLLKYKTVPGFHLLRKNASGVLELTRVDRPSPSMLEQFGAGSHLARYVFGNVGVGDVWLSLKTAAGLAPPRRWVGNAPFTVDAERYNASLEAIEYFLEQAPQLARLGRDRIVIAVDGIRPELYSTDELEAAGASYFGRMRSRILKRAAELGYEVVDLQPAFLEDYRRLGRRFEFDTDAHWNPHGHRVVADAIASTRVFSDVFEAR